MKKQITHPAQAHLLRRAFYLLLLLPVCVIPFALAQGNATKLESPTKFSQKTLTLAKRVAYQRAIEATTMVGNVTYAFPKISPGVRPWTGASSVTNAPDCREAHTAVWTGSEMIIWGGIDFFQNFFNTGGRYNPATDSWTATNTSDAPSARAGHTGVWTDSEMIIWGGTHPFHIVLNTGGRYNPSTDSWAAT